MNDDGPEQPLDTEEVTGGATGSTICAIPDEPGPAEFRRVSDDAMACDFADGARRGRTKRTPAERSRRPHTAAGHSAGAVSSD